MKNKKVIILSGFARGGTNIVWNILQSHPDIVAPPYETGQIFKRSSILRILNTGNLWKQIPFGHQVIDYILFRYKMESLRHLDNRYISEKTLYTRKQMGSSALCLKSVNDDILFTDILTNVYPNVFFIALTRNGYSLADGYIRRNKTAADAGRMYSRVAKQVQRFSSLNTHFKIVKFEDVLKNPFELAQELYSFVGASPCGLTKLRLKSKKIISTTGEHKTVFGNEHRKYWFSKETITEIIDPAIDQRQSNRLTNKDYEDFNREALSALQYFGYEVHR